MNEKYIVTSRIAGGAITISWHPYVTYKLQQITLDIQQELEGELDTPDFMTSVWHIVEVCAVDIKINSHHGNAHIIGLSDYWEKRGELSYAERLAMFYECISREIAGELWRGYSATRQELPGVSDDLAEGKPDDNDPKDTSDGGKRSGKKS